MNICYTHNEILWLQNGTNTFFWDVNAFRPNIKKILTHKPKKCIITFKYEYITNIGYVNIPYKIKVDGITYLNVK